MTPDNYKNGVKTFKILQTIQSSNPLRKEALDKMLDG